MSVSTRNIIQPTLNEKMQPVYIEEFEGAT